VQPVCSTAQHSMAHTAQHSITSVHGLARFICMLLANVDKHGEHIPARMMACWQHSTAWHITSQHDKPVQGVGRLFSRL
jgi:hypothetical protein